MFGGFFDNIEYKLSFDVVATLQTKEGLCALINIGSANHYGFKWNQLYCGSHSCLFEL